jgi:hypothetical protein
MDPLNIRQNAGCSVERRGGAQIADKTKLCGKFIIEHIRKGKVLQKFEVPNGITDVGMNALLDIMFHASSQITTWYIALVDNAGFSMFAAGDTSASHGGWSENTAYDEATRPEWTEGTASGRAITNGTSVDFTMNATNTIHGIFIISENTKGGATGTLWSTAAFSSNVSVVDDDVLKVTYTVSG